MSTNNETASDHAGAVLAVGVVFGVPADLLRAFVLTQLWQWFVTPYGLAPPSLLHAYGLIVLLAFLKGRSDQNKAASVVAVLALVANSVIASLVAWGMGALIFVVMA